MDFGVSPYITFYGKVNLDNFDSRSEGGIVKNVTFSKMKEIQSSMFRPLPDLNATHKRNKKKEGLKENEVKF